MSWHPVRGAVQAVTVRRATSPACVWKTCTPPGSTLLDAGAAWIRWLGSHGLLDGPAWRLWGGHGLCRGFATEAIAAGVLERDVQRHGRWHSRASMDWLTGSHVPGPSDSTGRGGTDGGG